MPGGLPSLLPGRTNHQEQVVQTLVQTRVTNLLLEWNQERKTGKLC